ncbi:zinc finger matrin-type protein 5 isoform 6-T7 [Podargus strigoides]
MECSISGLRESDAAAILQEEQTKKPCRKFLQTGQCDFGSNCRFSHMTEQDLEKLSAQVQGELRSKELWQEGADVPPGTIEDWLEKRAKRLSMAQSNRKRSVSVRVSVRFCRSCRGAHLLIAIPKGSEASKALRYHRFHECGNGKRRGIPLMPLERKHS